ncbi:hypothetical protein Salat_2896700 [Sesamum alatum]|uniref:Myb/SANT-like domain-containing protein n=1 Tax=Sesamum alatum TaxID=300844 RepID=A0AAE1XIH8_9LAMI|nr:hypothetical protein Salat_2896700 [Sesamum alatum]
MADENPPPLGPAAPPPLFEPRPQRHYFYTNCWSRRHDNVFIRALYYQDLRGQKQLSRTPNMHSLNCARCIVNACFNWSLKYIIFKRRLERLRLCYTTFRTISDSPGFEWDRSQNVVHALMILQMLIALRGSLTGKNLRRYFHEDARRKDSTDLWPHLAMRVKPMMRTMTMEAWTGGAEAALFRIKK